MAFYYISDLHLCHENIIRLDNRPFDSLTEMHRVILENWNMTVKPEDTVYILGDFCWAKEEEWLRIVPQFLSKKVLILGNHDLKQFSQSLKRQFQSIQDYKEITDTGRHVILSHYPMPFHRAAYNKDCYMLFGHVHATRENDLMNRLREDIRADCTERGRARGNFVNVGCMMPWMGYTPRTLDEIICLSGLWPENKNTEV